MSLIRLILYFVLFYLVYHTVKKFFNFLFTPNSEIKGNSPKKAKTFDPGEIEDVDYEEVERKDD